MAAGLADLDVPAEHRCPAGDERLHYLGPCGGEPPEPPLSRQGAQQVGYLQCRPRHSDQGIELSRSSGLGVACRRCVDTCV